MTEMTQTGREELKRAYELANSGDHNHLHVYVDLSDGSEAICEVFETGTVHVEHPDGCRSGVLRAGEMAAHNFFQSVREVVER